VPDSSVVRLRPAPAAGAAPANAAGLEALLAHDGLAALPEREVRRIGYRVGLRDGAVSRVSAAAGGRELDCWFPHGMMLRRRLL
jgi:hypothetical protein